MPPEFWRGKYVEINWQVYFVVCLISASFAAIFIKQKFATLLVCTAFISAGAFCFQVKTQTISENRIKKIYDEKRIESGEPVEVEGILRGKPESAVGGFFVELKAEKLIYKGAEQNVSGNIRLFASIQGEQIQSEYEQLNLQYGARIRVATNLERENKFQNLGAISKHRNSRSKGN